MGNDGKLHNQHYHIQHGSMQPNKSRIEKHKTNYGKYNNQDTNEIVVHASL